MVSVIIDGNYCLHMVMHVDSYDELSVRNSKTGGVFGALKVMRKIVDLFRADDCYVAWDGGSSCYRLGLYPDYKKNRILALTEEERAERDNYYESFYKQKTLVVRLLKNLGVRSFELAGIEGDDVIYLLAKTLKPNVVIASEDVDMAQMVKKGISWYRPRLDKTLTIKNFNESFGVTPMDIPLFKSIVGDVSDNINGVRRVGKKTAEKALVGFRTKFGKCALRSTPEFFVYCKKDKSKLINMIADNQDIVCRNLALIDLSRFPWKKKSTTVIAAGITSKVCMDTHFVRRVFANLKFDSLLEIFSVWVQPFKLLKSVSRGG